MKIWDSVTREKVIHVDVRVVEQSHAGTTQDSPEMDIIQGTTSRPSTALCPRAITAKQKHKASREGSKHRDVCKRRERRMKHAYVA